MAQLTWYLKRLRVMSGREVLHRLGQQLTLLQLLARHRMGLLADSTASGNNAGLQFCTAQEPQLPSLTFDLTALQYAAPALLAGNLTVCGRSWQWQPRAGVWHRAPDTGRPWPKRFFAGIPYRDGNPFGDVRQLWEPARLQQLVDLAAIANRSSAEQQHQAVHMITAQLASWVDDNPPLTGAHYISAMECALRLIAVCHALDMVRPQLSDPSPWRALALIVHSHAPLIAQRLSTHSSTGNHTIAEASGLVYAGLLFPEFNDARLWSNTGLAILEQAASSQVLPDGGGAEQALAYHLFNMQLFTLVKALLSQRDHEVPPAIASAVKRGWAFLAAMRGAEGQLPRIGDSDDGFALSRYLVFPQFANPAPPELQTFEHAGYTVARLAANPSLRLIVDHGALGMPPAYGHGHADALSLLLLADNEDLLLDPGTCTYTGDQEHRRYFRGTRAHNTVMVDGQDQATHEGPFLWSRPFQVHVIASESGGDGTYRLLAEHDGYRHLGVRHVRGLAWLPDQWLLVWDALFGEGQRELELNWHLGSTPIRQQADTFELHVGDRMVHMRCTGGSMSTHRGERSPLSGWRSRSYGTLEPITTVRLTYTGPLPHAFLTHIRLSGGDQGTEGINEDAIAWMEQHCR